MAIVQDRDLQVTNETIDRIIKNMPHGGYAIVAKKLNMGDDGRKEVRKEIIERKQFYNSEIINACLELVEFTLAKTEN